MSDEMKITVDYWVLSEVEKGLGCSIASEELPVYLLARLLLEHGTTAKPEEVEQWLRTATFADIDRLADLFVGAIEKLGKTKKRTHGVVLRMVRPPGGEQ